MVSSRDGLIIINIHDIAQFADRPKKYPLQGNAFDTKHYCYQLSCE